MGEKKADFKQDRFSGHGDDFYAALMDAHDGLDRDESVKLNARLVLLLANQVGDIDVLKQILAEACRDAGGEGDSQA